MNASSTLRCRRPPAFVGAALAAVALGLSVGPAPGAATGPRNEFFVGDGSDQSLLGFGEAPLSIASHRDPRSGRIVLAGAQARTRQTASFTFNTERAGRATSLELALYYANPGDPNAKPYAVQTVVEKLAAGTRIDTSVPERCDAPDAAIIARGPPACPPGSRVGGGRVVLDTGNDGNRILEFDVAQFNSKDQLILLFEAANGSGLRAVSRAPIEEGTITANAPPLPGGPPDGFTAIKTVRLRLASPVPPARGHRSASTKAGRHYITTPPWCPADGTWEHEFRFLYRDGDKQEVTSDSPCQPGPPPRIRVRGIPRPCAGHPFKAHVRIKRRSGAPLRRARARLDGTVLRTAKHLRFDVAVTGARLARSRQHRLTVVARDAAGLRTTKTVRFKSC